MKKIIAVMLVLVLALSLAACGGGKKSNDSDGRSSTSPSRSSWSDSSPSGGDIAVPSVSGKAINALIEWMIAGKYCFDFDMITETPDGKSEGSGSIAVEGDKMMMRSESVIDGHTYKSRMISIDNTMYIIDDENKTIMEMATTNSSSGGMFDNYSNIKLVSSGVGEINGKTLPYEEYADSDPDSDSESRVKYFMDGGNVYGMISGTDEYRTTMIIRNQKNSIPAGTFDLPSGYTTSSLGGFGADGFNLEDYMPDGYDPDDYDPDNYYSDDYDPNEGMPEGFNINDYLPEGFNMEDYLPEGFNMEDYLPQG